MGWWAEGHEEEALTGGSDAASTPLAMPSKRSAMSMFSCVSSLKRRPNGYDVSWHR